MTDAMKNSESVAPVEPILQLNNLSKAFPGVKALQSIDFALYPGEVHVLAGENGAGKSTLTKCILGVYPPDQGRIIFQGEEVHFRNTADAISHGIGAVYQELTMIPHLDAARNIYFGKEPTYGISPVINTKKMYADARKIMEGLHCEDLDLHVPVKDLSVARQQMIEIAKALTLNPRVIIFDEPTTSLTSTETEFLFERIRKLKEQGIAILFISHKMNEIRRIGDKITILRDGRLISCDRMSSLTEEEIIRRMIGRDLGHIQAGERKVHDSVPLMKVTDLCDKKGKVNHCSLELYGGEIVGLAGMVGSGRTELARLIYGVDEASSGEILYHGESFSRTSPVQMVRRGMGLLPEDRKHEGLALLAPVHWNILASSLKKHFPAFFMTEKRSGQISEEYINRLDIDTPGSGRIVEELSGGNQQKVVLAKWLSADTDLLIFDEPTKGIDIGAKQEIYRLLRLLADRGKSILVISSEMEELMRVCDRLYCLKDGRITGSLEREAFSQETIGRMILAGGEGDPEEGLPDKSTSEGSSEPGHRGRKILSSLPPAFYMNLILIIFFSLRASHYLSFSNLTNILTQSAALLVLACGQSLIVLIQGTDLSLGTLVSFLGVLWVFLLNCGLPMLPAILITLVCGAFCGFLNGLIVARGRIPVFIVTLGTQNIFKSLALLVCGSQTLYFNSPVFRLMAKNGLLGFTYITWISVGCFLFTIFLINKTIFGMRVRGIGGNPQGVVYSGAGIDMNRIMVFLFAGIMAAVSALILCCRIESGNPVAGSGMEFNSIAAVLLGGVSMREGKGRVEGIFFGVLLIQILKSGLTQIGMSSVYQNATIGIVVLIAIMIDAALKKMEERGRGLLS